MACNIWHPHSQFRVTAASTILLVLFATCILNNLPGLTSCCCDNIGLVSLILLGCELRVLYHCTICTRHPDLVSLDFYAIPIFHIITCIFMCSTKLLKGFTQLFHKCRSNVYSFPLYLAHILLILTNCDIYVYSISRFDGSITVKVRKMSSLLS